ncbi:MAG: PAS domain S-box protein, partial [Pseudomonadota bacterium]
MANPIDTRSLSGSKSFQDLAAFDRYHSEAGLRRRYVSGRTRAMGQRLWVGFVGIVILTVLISPQVGFLAAAIHIPAELTEFFIFRRLLARGDFESRSSEWTIRAATGIQAIGMCAPIALCGLHGEGLRVLAWSYFLGATINSILTARHHRSSHMIRMSMLFGAAAIVLLEAYFIAGLGAIDVLTEVTAVGAMIYMLYYLFTHLDRRDMRTVAAERNLLLQSTMAQRLALVAEHATDSVILMDANQHITWVNDQFTQLTGFTLAEVGGRHPGDFLNHPDTDPAEVARIVDAAASQKPVNALLLNRRKDGTTLW